ncbi:hypothetical protein K466DRAFT_61088 [Polyporus arcularius HHB13444]|uniref:Uncharacterized protein n=1 Tax=Polyporus arcularius HHB13444 TaxID=1314778 RepID=A0A5C3PG38_9APHY|nr:hypothetical protein K466DRAFT_61088 [Polyporus arcularius HHB13444]
MCSRQPVGRRGTRADTKVWTLASQPDSELEQHTLRLQIKQQLRTNGSTGGNGARRRLTRLHAANPRRPSTCSRQGPSLSRTMLQMSWEMRGRLKKTHRHVLQQPSWLILAFDHSTARHGQSVPQGDLPGRSCQAERSLSSRLTRRRIAGAAILFMHCPSQMCVQSARSAFMKTGGVLRACVHRGQ